MSLLTQSLPILILIWDQYLHNRALCEHFTTELHPILDRDATLTSPPILFLELSFE